MHLPDEAHLSAAAPPAREAPDGGGIPGNGAAESCAAGGGAQHDAATEDAVRHALRTVRATAYSVVPVPGGVALALVMRASDAGRRTAARRIVDLLAAHGLALRCGDPVADLLTAGAGVPVRAGTPG